MSTSILAGRASCIAQIRTLSCSSRAFTTSAPRYEQSSYVPRVANPELWKSLVPKFMRRRRDSNDATAVATSERSTGMSLIILGLLAGSFAINILALRREMLNFSRKTNAKIATLREVIRGIRNGEDIDVKKALGTGDPEAEAEWEELMRDLEQDDVINSVKEKAKAQPPVKSNQRKTALPKSRPSSGKAQRPDSEALEEEKKQSKPNFMM